MQIRQFFTPGLAIVSYIIFDEFSRHGAVIDPTRHIENYLLSARQENINITHILETHVHADFASGAKDLKEVLQGKPQIYCSGLGGKEWSPQYADHLVKDREDVKLGSVRLQAWHTPGHTPEHVIWVVYDDHRNTTIPALAFTGDLLFVGSIGRPDLLGNGTEAILSKQLYHSLFDTLPALPDYLEILPAHGAGSLCGKEIGSRQSSTLGYERLCNPWLIKQPYETWSANLLKDMPAAPSYFKRLKRLNVTGSQHPIPKELPPMLNLEQTLKLIPSCLIIDVRNPELFAAGHLKDAINVPLAPSFTTWVGTVIPENQDVLIVSGESQEAIFAIQSLKLLGIDSIKGVCSTREWHKNEWSEILHRNSLLIVTEVQDNKNNYYILDIRTPGEWNAGHIQEAHHIELALVPNSLSQIPKDKPIAVVCGSGMRASIITSLLNREGYQQAVNVRGGMHAWTAAGLPTVKIS